MKYILLLLLFPFFLHAQSEFMDSSRVGLKLSFAYSGSDNSTGRGVDAAVSILGIFDFGMQFASAEINNTPFSSKGNLYYLAFNSKTGNNKNCIKIILGYADETITQEYYGNFQVTGPVAGLDLFLKIYENENITVMPDLGVLYGFLSIDTKGIYNNSGYDNARNAFLNLNFKLNLTKQIHLLFIPSISKDLVNSDNPLAFGMEVGLFLNTIKGI